MLWKRTCNNETKMQRLDPQHSVCSLFSFSSLASLKSKSKLLAILIVLLLAALFSFSHSDMAAANKLKSIDYEVFGKVQGVFFRKHTQQEATKLGLFGWVKNTKQGTVVGVAQGPENKISLMKTWLKTKGSPKSRIDKCEFKNERSIEKPEFSKFDVIREPGDE